MAKKSKVLMTWKDSSARWIFGFAALLALASLTPVLPWRKAAQTPVFHGRFSIYRTLSLVSMTDKNTAYQPFSKWKREMCMLMKTYSTPDLLSNLGGAAATVFAQKTGFSPATAMGCKMWQACKDTVSVRCYGYQTLMWVGFGVMAMIVISVICSVAVPCMIASDVAMKASGKKKKQKKEEAMFSTMICSLVALAFSIAAMLTYYFVTDSIFKSFQSGSYYPYPAAYTGMYLFAGVIFLQMIGAFIVVIRLYPIGGAKGEKGDDDGDDDANAGMQQPMMGGPGYGSPPMMMSGPPQPGMPMGGRPNF